MKRARQSTDLKIEVVEGPEMTPEQVEAVAGLLAEWVIRDMEKAKDSDEPREQSGLGSQA